MMTEKEKARRTERYEDYKLAYAALMLVYPFTLEDLEGEEWKKIPYNEEFYQISTYGRVKSFQKGKIKILKPCLHNCGYLYVELFKNCKCKKAKIHQLVAEAFIPNPENKKTVDHVYGNKFDNYFENLSWKTQAENNQAAYDTGLKKSGEDSYQAKLTNEQVLEIRRDYISNDIKFGAAAFAEKFNVVRNLIYGVVAGKTYKHVEDDKQTEGNDKNNECI